MKNPFKEKDRVYHFVHGWGDVTDLDDDLTNKVFVVFKKFRRWLHHKELSFTEYEPPKVNHKRKVTIEVSEEDLMLIEALDAVVKNHREGVKYSVEIHETEKLTNKIKKALEE